MSPSTLVKKRVISTASVLSASLSASRSRTIDFASFMVLVRTLSPRSHTAMLVACRSWTWVTACSE
jgi:predicted transcriptional regulator